MLAPLIFAMSMRKVGAQSYVVGGGGAGALKLVTKGTWLPWASISKESA